MLANRLHQLLAMLTGLALGSVPALAIAQSPPSRPPNLLIITVDTLRVDHVGVYGYAKAKTSTIDQIASMSVRFENEIGRAHV